MGRILLFVAWIGVAALVLKLVHLLFWQVAVDWTDPRMWLVTILGAGITFPYYRHKGD